MADNQHKADLDRVTQQNSFTDFARGIESQPRGGGFFNDLVVNPVRSVVEATPYGKAMHGRTSFENYDLNQMLDLVEQTDPEDLESSGRALWDARDAIKAAATELSGHIEHVHWVGESGDAFRTWGQSLVKNTHELSDFTGGAGDQITAAAVGLASVRKAMPPRDHRTDPKAPKDFPKAEQVGTNDAYTAAVQVEKHRQEAINQMNRLSSYYSVSTEELKGWQSKAPEFQDMPDVGVPRPAPVAPDPSGHPAQRVSTGTGPHGAPSHHATVAPVDQVVGHGPLDTVEPAQYLPHHTVHPDVPVGTNIDSVGTLPPPSTVPVTDHTPPATGVPGVGGGPHSTFGSGYGSPIPPAMPGGGAGRAGGLRPPVTAPGRTGTSGVSNSGSGRSTGRGPMNQTGRAANQVGRAANQMGRATSTGQQTAKGLTSGAKPAQPGRGVTGGTPRAGGPATPRNGAGPATGAGRANGVVGGRPTAASGPTAKGGARIPRGTVVGAEESANARSGAAGRPGQRGVFGSSVPTERQAASAAGPRGGTAASEAITARPAARGSAVRAERNGMTRGGAGLVRGTGSQAKSEEQRKTEGTPRPESPVDENGTHLPTKPRRDVPPVVN